MSQALLPPKKRKENHSPPKTPISTTPLPTNYDHKQLPLAPSTNESTEEPSSPPALAASPPRLRVKRELGMKWDEDDITEKGRGKARGTTGRPSSYLTLNAQNQIHLN